MARGETTNKRRRGASSARSSVATAAAPMATIAPSLTPEAVVEALENGTSGSPASLSWWYPNDFLITEAAQFHDRYGLDPAVSVRLLKDPADPMPGEDYFEERRRFYWPKRKMVALPEDSCPGMKAAGATLANALTRGERIAVFADYDPDGTCSAEALRLALMPYCTTDCAPCKGSGDIDCPKCKGKGKLSGKRCPAKCDDGSVDCPTCEGGGDLANPDQLMIRYASAQDGFGVTHGFMQEAKDEGCSTVVTVDCGSSQVEQMAFAKKLGMTTIVVDHHDVDPTNPADFHLNPQLHRVNQVIEKHVNPKTGEVTETVIGDEPISHNTGAQLAWKLGASVQMAMEGKTLPEHWQRAMYLAGFGCRADMGSAIDPENRAFFWYGLDYSKGDCVPPGLELLATELGEDPFNPGTMIQTSACMNLSKRTPKADAAAVGRILAAETAEEARPYVEKLVNLYREAQPVKARLVEKAIEQVTSQTQTTAAEVEAFMANVHAAGTYGVYVPSKQLTEPRALTAHTLRTAQKDAEQGKRFAHVVLDDDAEWAGYSGIVATRVSREANKPAIVFCSKGLDDHGQEMYKFSIRNESRVDRQLGELLNEDLPENASLRSACTFLRADSEGRIGEDTSVGGHAEVVSGNCTKDQIAAVVAACEQWAHNSATVRGRGGWKVKPPYTGATEFLAERFVAADRLPIIEEQALRLAPFSSKDQHRPVSISILAELDEPVLDEESGFSRTIMRMDDGSEREALMRPDRVAELPRTPEGKIHGEFVLNISNPGRYFLRAWGTSDEAADFHVEAGGDTIAMADAPAG